MYKSQTFNYLFIKKKLMIIDDTCLDFTQSKTVYHGISFLFPLRVSKFNSSHLTFNIFFSFDLTNC